MANFSSDNSNTVILCICVVDEQSSLKKIHVNRIRIQNVIDTKLNGRDPVHEIKERFTTGALLKSAKSNTVIYDEIIAEICSFSTSESFTSQKYDLTNREREVLSLLIEGRTKKDISKILFVSHNTIGTHINHIYQKLNVTNRGSVVAKALKEKLLL
jgi:DNA-binding CsgD family transcriptional regulator